MTIIKKYSPFAAYLILAILLTGLGLGLSGEAGLMDDGLFHYGRFQYLYEQVGEGSLFNSFYSDGFLKGMGYPMGIFYPQAMLYPFVLLGNLFNLSTLEAFRLMYVAIFFMIPASAHCAVIRFYHKNNKQNIGKLALWGALIYSLLPPIVPINISVPWLPYPLLDFMSRYAVGELLAMIFIPWVIVGIKEILDKKTPKGTVLLFSLVGILYSHILTGLIAGALVISAYLLYMRRVSGSKKIVMESIKTMLLFLLIGAYQIFPMLEMMFFQDYVYGGPNFNPGSLSDYAVPVMRSEFPAPILFFQTAIGIRLLIGIVRTKDTFSRMNLTGLFILYASSKLFPWQIMGNTPLAIVQFPFRLLMIPNALFLFGLPHFILSHKRAWMERAGYAFFCIIITVSVLSLDNIQEQFTEKELNEYSSLCIGAGGEYLPGNFSTEGEMFEERRGFTMDYTDEKTNQLIDIALKDDHLLPVFHQKGYSIKLDNKLIPYSRGYSGLIATDIPIKESEVSIIKDRTPIQDISFALTAASMMSLIGCKLKKKYSRPA